MSDSTTSDKVWKNLACGSNKLQGTVVAHHGPGVDAARLADKAIDGALNLTQEILDKVAAEPCPSNCSEKKVGDARRTLLDVCLSPQHAGIFVVTARAKWEIEISCNPSSGGAAPQPPAHVLSDLHCGLNDYHDLVTATEKGADQKVARETAERMAEDIIKVIHNKLSKLNCPGECPEIRRGGLRSKLASIDLSVSGQATVGMTWGLAITCSPKTPQEQKPPKKKPADTTDSGSGDKGDAGGSSVKCPAVTWVKPAGTILHVFTWKQAQGGGDGLDEAEQDRASGAGRTAINALYAAWQKELDALCAPCKGKFQNPPVEKLAMQMDLGKSIDWKVVLQDDLVGTCVP